MKIIVFEDDPTLSEMFAEMLEDRGHQVTSVYGASQIRDERIVGISPTGQDVELSTAAFDLAVVDGKLLGRYQGWEIVPLLTAAHLPCIAHSSEDNSNRRMCEQGAQHSVLKTGIRALQAVVAGLETVQ